MSLSFAIMGLRFGAKWAEAVRLENDVSLAGVFDLQTDKMVDCLAGANDDARAYGSFEDILADESVDVVGVFTPAPLHADQSVAALEAGKHVLSAVPVALTLEDCRRVIHAVETTGRAYMLAENWPYTPSILEARRRYAAGEFGRLFYAEAEYIHDLRSYEVDPDGSKTWRFGSINRHPLYYCTHGFGPFVHMTGDRFVEVTAFEGEKDPSDGQQRVEVAVLRSAGGALFKIMNSFRNAHPGGHYFSFYGDRGSFETGRFRDAYNVAHFWIEGTDSPHAPNRKECAHDLAQLPGETRNDHRAEARLIVRDFASALATGRRPPIDVYDAVAMTAPGICAVQSIEEGAKIAVPRFDSPGPRR